MSFRRAMSVVVALAAMTGAVLVAAPASAAPAEPYCGITWGSGEKSTEPTSGTALVNIRAGRNDCYDRLVFDLRAPVSPTCFIVSYVDRVIEDPTGAVVPVRGGAKLQVTVCNPAYDMATGQPTYVYGNRAELVDVTGFQTFRQVAWAGSFENTTSVGLGVRARLPFRAFVLGDRVVVDVAHFW
jgi:hypothetical protein